VSIEIKGAYKANKAEAHDLTGVSIQITHKQDMKTNINFQYKKISNNNMYMYLALYPKIRVGTCLQGCNKI
jgi:hypothetical protein